MSGTSQTALERYKAHRGATSDQGAASPPTRKPTSGQTWILLGLLLGILGYFGWQAYDRLPGEPLQLTYEVDLSGAPSGQLVITLLAEGKLPPTLDLDFPSGLTGVAAQNNIPTQPTAHALKQDGRMGQPLTVDRFSSGWRLGTRGLRRVGFIYRVDITRCQATDSDIRRHISTPISGGVRFAGYEVFLEPSNAQVSDITVTVRNPDDLPVLVPWPALVHSHEAAPPAEAHLGYGQGFLPADKVGSGNLKASALSPGNPTEALPTNLFFHPTDLADLNNALLVCGNIRTLDTQTRNCVIQLATDRDWYFRDHEALDLIERVARTEMGFFGAPPADQITVLLSANEVQADGRFDVYGIHTGSSILVMLDPKTTLGMLEDQAASVIAHEMFHGWLGEAITQSDPVTLWFTEGATTWYAARMLTASGIWTPAHARQVLADRLNRDYINNPWRGKISLAEAAGQVMGDPQMVRYSYAGGVAACMALDQWLGQQCDLVRPLDEVLRYLYDHADEENLSRKSLEAAVLAVTGVDCASWLEAHVYHLEPIPPVERLI